MQMHRLKKLEFLRLLGLLAAAWLAAPSAHAQSVEEFYAGKVVTLYIGFSPGGGYDTYGRLVARHIGQYIPGNPTIVPVNMEGAGSLRLANWLYNAAPNDGLSIGTVNRGIPFEPMVGKREFAQFDPTKFTWIGSANNETSICAAWERTGITRIEQLYDQELFVGGTGPSADDHVFPTLVRGVLGLKMNLVTGYAGGNDVDFAMERGELDGRCGWSWSSVKATRSTWLEAGSIKILLQLAMEKAPDLPDVPLVMDLAENEDDRQILRLFMLRLVLGRPYLGPPGIPEDRAEALRRAFDRMVEDPQFLAEAERSRLEVSPTTGEEVQRLLAEAYATPRELIERAHALVN
jgi:tripartite-type tricarboxylate transporter receptor subunit TctC